MKARTEAISIDDKSRIVVDVIFYETSDTAIVQQRSFVVSSGANPAEIRELIQYHGRQLVAAQKKVDQLQPQIGTEELIIVKPEVPNP